MASFLDGKVVYVIGSGDDAHRAVAVALAQAGAGVAIGGKGVMPGEVALHSIANEIWALGRRSAVIPIDELDPKALPVALTRIEAELGQVATVVHCEGAAPPS